ncbi:MAG: type III-A CRISPR-associated RAMP protein Csm3 [Candidatus Aminicenantes bacterium]|nr:type III-A CRISPR-associated RAMP protein Csm3 [Candidatus Aminicenantes bacterium]
MNHYLKGKVIIVGQIEVKTGMRIGGSTSGLKIGGLDLNVITDPEGRPYIPGSSLKGKLRSLMEKKEAANKADFWNVEVKGQLSGHKCERDQDYANCPVCKIWGIAVSDNIKLPTPTRLIVCDSYLDLESLEKIKDNLELEYTEVKFETAINRLTGTALHGSLRQIERVPAGARFKDVEMIYNVYDEQDKDLLRNVFIALELLEHDYLGGMGSRGYGRVSFNDIKIFWNKKEDYEKGQVDLIAERVINKDLGTTPAEIVRNFTRLREKLI